MHFGDIHNSYPVSFKQNQVEMNVWYGTFPEAAISFPGHLFSIDILLQKPFDYNAEITLEFVLKNRGKCILNALYYILKSVKLSCVM